MNINNLTDSAQTWNHVIIPRTRNISRFLLINVKTLLTDWSPKEYLSPQRDKCWMRQGQPEFRNLVPCTMISQQYCLSPKNWHRKRLFIAFTIFLQSNDLLGILADCFYHCHGWLFQPLGRI